MSRSSTENLIVVWNHTIKWRKTNLCLLLAASVTLVSALGRVWVWGVLKGSRMCSWEAAQLILLHDIHSLNPSPASSSPRLREYYCITRFCCSWLLLLLPLVQGAWRTQTTSAWGVMAEIFSDGKIFAATSAAATRCA
jgi:hypothetical protein